MKCPWGQGSGPQLTQDLQVGWTPVNLARKLLEKGNRVNLVLKKIPLELPGSPPSPRQQVSDPSAPSPAPVPHWAMLGVRQRCSELAEPCQAGLSGAGGCPGGLCSPLATRLSRRRVSCRDLGRVDCDGWLLKKKEHVGFMAQKWKRCWVVLKGHTVYWYNHPNDERAAGLINVATYNLESTREQKKKYVFQLCHQTYKPFVFAAETLADLRNFCLLPWPPDCYSETEAEDPDDESSPSRTTPRSHAFGARGSPAGFGGCPPAAVAPVRCPEPGGEDLESLARCLRQGGVSLMGQRRVLTQEQCRKSFLRRNRNPHINERVHAVRALQSTLKAKLAELQALEQLLGEAALTSDTFRRWKEQHQELYQELREGWAGQEGQGQEQGGAGEAAEP
uniref:Connector enhancer of kinase suppressor of Ras 1 n=1 Tax=Serinus canaria TaxID=9135 RepID=A0A8C9MXE9_SERCA